MPEKERNRPVTRPDTEYQKSGENEDMLKRFFRRIIPETLAVIMLLTTGIAEEAADMTALTIEQQPDNVALMEWTIYSETEKLDEYIRPVKDRIHMPAGDQYTRFSIGILTFRNNAFRQNAAIGTVKKPVSLYEIWRVETGSISGTDSEYCGTGWPGQPAIVQWAVQIREESNIYDAKKEHTALKEVIIGCLDGGIRFLDLADGTQTRDMLRLGHPMSGTPSVHPSGFPYMSIGQSALIREKADDGIGLRQYNLYRQTEIQMIDGLDNGLNRILNQEGSFETSALIDRSSDTMITAGSNGMLYLISLNSMLDWQQGFYQSQPTAVVLTCRYGDEEAADTAIKSSPAMYDRYVFYADMGGILRCVDTDTLTPMWAADTGDSVMAAVALDQRSPETLDLYTANMLNKRQQGKAQVRRFDALTGREIWCTEIGVEKTGPDSVAGCQASPVIGQNRLADMVYFTVTGLDSEGCETINVPQGTKAALVALDKETGTIRWAEALDDESVSSPVAVYDDENNGWIIQCAKNGKIILADGLTGDVVTGLTVEGEIVSSPAVKSDTMVVGTTMEGNSYIYAIRIGSEP